jgi:hypothetical protein
MRDLIIVSEDTSKKGRSFRGTLLAHAACSRLWLGGDKSTLRPIWAMVATSDAEAFPFVRNLQLGHKAQMFGDRGSKADQQFDCLKSAGYDMKPQRHVVGHEEDGRPVVAVAWTIYLPEAYRVDPGMVDPEQVKFALMPSTEWAPTTNEQIATRLADLYRSHDFNDWQISRGADREEYNRRLGIMRYVVRVAPLFADRLDRRTMCPLIPELGFYALVLAAMLDRQYVSLSGTGVRGDRTWGCSGLGYDEDLGLLSDDKVLPGLVCSVMHVNLAPLLASCVKAYEAGVMDPARDMADMVADWRRAA